MTSTEVVKTAAAELGMTEDEYLALMGQQEGEFDEQTLTAPILKIGQPLTKEVQAEAAEAGEFINTLLGEGIGDKIDFIVAYYQQGRFAADRKTGKGYSAFGETIPEHWAELPFIGEQFVGTRFDEHPDAEEVYKERVNNEEIEWGSGPEISTTHNYTGFAIVSPLEDDEDAEPEYQPVRLSLKRTDMKAVRKINTLKRSFLRGRPFWDKMFEFGTEKNTFKKGMAYGLTAKLGRVTTPEERLMAAELAKAVAAGRVDDNQESSADAERPRADRDREGALGV